MITQNTGLEMTDFLTLPKIELHLHLDCSLSFDVVSVIKPSISFDRYKSEFIAPGKCKSLADLLKHSPKGIELMQTSCELELVTQDLFKQLKNENVIYAEIRFAPLLHLEKGLKAEEVVEVVAEAIIENMEKTGIKVGLILCTLRHFTEEQSKNTVRLVKKYINTTPVAGFDIAADEAGFPIDAHIDAFHYAITHDLPRTAHAGESRGPESIWETLKYFKPSRLGHGVRCIENSSLIEHLVKKNIHLEVCPTCNVQTDIFNKYVDHPIDHLFKEGVSIGINTDGRTLSDISLTDEYLKLHSVFGWGMTQFRICNLNAISHSFLTDSEKQDLVDEINNAYTV